MVVHTGLDKFEGAKAVVRIGYRLYVFYISTNHARAEELSAVDAFTELALEFLQPLSVSYSRNAIVILS